jgi:hypothetical protein
MVQGIDRGRGQNGGQSEEKGTVLQSSSMGGLNVMSSQLSIPLEDSPSMRNTKVNQRGNVQTREGTSIAGEIKDDTYGLSGTRLVPIKLRNLEPLILVKTGLDIIISTITELGENTARDYYTTNERVKFPNVFSERARYVKPDYTYTSELNPRVIFTSGVNPPIQVTFVQATVLDNQTSVGDYDGDGNNELRLPFENTDLYNANVNNIVLYNNGIDITDEVGQTTYSGGTFNVDVENTNREGEFIVTFISWQWWAESVGVLGKRLYGRATRLNTDPVDRFLANPQDILLGLRLVDNEEDGRYPLKITPTNDYADRNNFTFTQGPSNASEYTFTNTAAFVDPGDAPYSGLTYTAFGDTKGTSDPTPVHYHRGLGVFFNGARGIKGNNLAVRVGDASFSQNTDPNNSSENTYYLYPGGDDWINGPLTDGSTRGEYIDFTSESKMGVAFDSRVIATNVDTSFVGSSASSNEDSFGEGSYIPVFGLWEFCDYQEGSFPRTISAVQGRLVLGGTPKLPLQTAVSEVFDTFEPGRNFADFQTRLNTETDAEPFGFNISADINDSIRAIEELNDSLFVFTQNSTYRLLSGDQGLTPQSFFVQFQVELGAANSRSVQRIENTMFFLSNNGLYDISATDTSANFAAAERSIKVREYFQDNDFDQETAWLTYDKDRSELYVGLSNERTLNDSGAERLLVYSVFRNAWTEYTTNSGLFFSLDGAAIQRTDTTRLVMLAYPVFTDLDSTGSPKRVLLLLANQFRPVDFLSVIPVPQDLASPTAVDSSAPRKRYAFTLNKNQYYYPINRTSAYDIGDYGYFFDLLPHREIQDIDVLIDYDGNGNFQQLVFNEDYIKLRDGIYLTDVVPGGYETLLVTSLTQPEDKDWVDKPELPRVWLDNVLQIEGTDYVVRSDPNNNYRIIMLKDLKKDQIVEFGLAYSAWHASPLFFRSNMSSIKRFLHYYGYFNNSPYHDVYTQEDVNQNSNQDSSEIVDKYINPVGFNIAFFYNDNNTGFTSDNDTYGSFDLFWDTSYFDIDTPESQFKEYSRIAEPIIGATYDFQAIILRKRVTTFELVGYQITLINTGRTSNIGTPTSNQFSYGGGGF